jgi:trans-aconitate methyltransferase
VEVALRQSWSLVGDELLSPVHRMAEPDDSRREMEILDAIAATYDPSDVRTFDHRFKRLQAGALVPRLLGRHILELGCATGQLTSLLISHSDRYDVVEGSAGNIEVARERVPDANFVHALWESFASHERYSDVLLVNALEHATDPVGLLVRARSWLADAGRIHAMVPNGLSLHRLVGVELGHLRDPISLSDGDIAQGHFRNYTVDTLTADIRSAGLRIVHWEGIFLKLLSNVQMMDWSPELTDAMAAVGRRFPEHCAVLYAVCERDA